MKYRTAKFRVRASEVAAAEKAIIGFVSKVADEPGTLRYESFREADGVSYLHLMSFADDAAEEAHRQTDQVSDASHETRFTRARSRACARAAPPSFPRRA